MADVSSIMVTIRVRGLWRVRLSIWVARLFVRLVPYPWLFALMRRAVQGIRVGTRIGTRGRWTWSRGQLDIHRVPR